MNSMYETLTGLFGDAETARLMAMLLLASGIFVAGMAFLLALARYFDPVRKRLDILNDTAVAPSSAVERMAEKLDRFSGLFLPRNQQLRNRTVDRLSHAGYRSTNRLLIYYFVRLSMMVALPVAVLLAAPAFPRVPPSQFTLYGAIAFLLGMILPSYFLDKKVAAHQRTLRNGLPDAIDLLVVCTEAGLGLNAAILRVAQVLVDIHPALAEELFLVTTEMRAGVDRSRSLANLAQRTGLDDIKGMVAVLGQSMRFGTSIAQTLRIYSEEFRDKRMQKADEEAAKLGTKMIFPLAFCILPGFFIVALGPTIIRALEVLPTLTK